MERAEHVREWVRLTEEKQSTSKQNQGASEVSAQVAPKSTTDNNGNLRAGRPESGINAAVRDLGIDRTEAQRSVNISESLTPEAKAAAVEAKLDDNQSVLLTLAKTPADQQVGKVKELAQHRRTSATAPREPDQRPDQRKVAAEELAKRLAARFSQDEWSGLVELFSTLKCKLLVEELGRLGAVPAKAHP